MKYFILSLLLLGACENTPASELVELKGMEVFIVPDGTCVVKLSDPLVKVTPGTDIKYIAADTCDNMQVAGKEFSYDNCIPRGLDRIACHPIPKAPNPNISDVDTDKLNTKLKDLNDRGCYIKCPDEK